MMNKTKVIVTILIVLIFVVAGFLVYTYAFGTNTTQNNIVNVTQNIIENEIKNVNEVNDNKNVVENNVITNTVPVVDEPKPEHTESEQEPVNEKTEIQEDNEQDKAIAIVKNDLGDSSGVSIFVDSVNSDGTYNITVRSENSGNRWYTVNTKTGKFTKEY